MRANDLLPSVQRWIEESGTVTARVRLPAEPPPSRSQPPSLLRLPPPPPADIGDVAWTRLVLGLAKLGGWRSAHFRKAMAKGGRWMTAVAGNGKGFPDLFLAHPVRRQALAAELKTGGGRRSKEQEAWADVLWCCNVPCYEWRPSDWTTVVGVLIGEPEGGG